MDREQYLQEIAGTYKRCIGIVIERSKKYASDEDPFKNFRSSAKFAGTSVAQGIMTRIGDKLSRLQNTLEREENGEEYADESLQDTVDDLNNYFTILAIWLKVNLQERDEANRQLPLFEPVVEAEPQEEPGLAKRAISAIRSLTGTVKVE